MIKKILRKIKRIIFGCYKRFISFIKNFISLFFYLIPINKNKITFNNFDGKGFGDNPKYLALEFMKDKKYNLIWFVKDKKEEIPKEIKKVRFGSLSHYFHMITAKLWIENVRGDIKPLFKRKGQTYLQTWHSGIFLKGVEKDVENLLPRDYVKQAKKDAKMSDFMLSNCKLQTEHLKKSFWFNGKVLEFGIPRDDVLYNPPFNEIENLKSKYGISGKKIVLFAPSFRNDKSFYNKLQFDVNILMNEIKSKFGNDYIFCTRIHPNDSFLINMPNFKDSINLTGESDSQLILSASDIVISDFSSMLLDFTITRKLVLFYADDYSTYIKKERFLYYDLKTCGIPFADTFEKLINNIKNFDENIYKKNINNFLNYFGLFQDGKSSDKIVNYLRDNNLI